MTLRKITEDYQKKLAAAADQAGKITAWNEFLIEKYKLDRDPRIFPVLQFDVKEKAMVNYYKYVRNEITDRQFYDKMKECAELYLQNLLDAGIIPDEDTSEMVHNIALESVKATDTIGKRATIPPREGTLTKAEQDFLDESDRTGTTVYYHYMDIVHTRFGLPSVQELAKVLDLDVARNDPFATKEAEVLDGDDYDEFALTAREKTQLERRLGLSVSVQSIR